MQRNKNTAKTQNIRKNAKYLLVDEFFCKRIIFICLITLFIIYPLVINLYAQEEFIYNPKGKRDPFIPLVTPDGRLLKLEEKEGIAGLLLEGIIYDERGSSYAIINSEVAKIGDIINDYQVLKIEKDKVIFIKDDQPVEVELKKGEE